MKPSLAAIVAVMCLLFAPSLAGVQKAQAQSLRVAVAASFARPASALSERFEQDTGHAVTVVTGSTGKLVAQIAQGAPFDVLLAADQAGPAWLLESGDALADSRVTYTCGRLVLYSASLDLAGDDVATVLRSDRFRYLAVANPRLAPYGRAAQEVLSRLNLLEDLRGRLVFGENVGQAFAMAASGNAQLALVAAFQVTAKTPGAFLPVPAQWHQPIAQDGIVVARSGQALVARQYLDFVASQAFYPATDLLDAVRSPDGLDCGSG